VIATVVDTGDLLEVIWVSLVAGIGVTAAFGLAIVGSTRAMELGRAGRPAEAVLFGAMGVVAMAAVLVAIVYGIVVLTDK
jgi:hypothetical protein